MLATVSAVERRSLRVHGVVQGVGFRPFVHRLATSLGVGGSVGNDAAGVVIEVVGPAHVLDEFERRLVADAPRLAVVVGVDVLGVAGVADVAGGFRIVPSGGGGEGTHGAAGGRRHMRRLPRRGSPIRRTAGTATRSSTARSVARG